MLTGYKAVYLPLAKYMTPAAAEMIEDYVRGGGVLVCGDAEAFGFDLAGNDTSATRERILGIRALGPLSKRVSNKGTKTRSPTGVPDKIILKSAQWGCRPGLTSGRSPSNSETTLPLATAQAIALADPKAAILGTYPDGSPAIVSHELGQGRVITFAANPFAPQVTVDASLWPAAFKGLQQSLACRVDQPIWHFAIPAPAP